MKKLFYIFLLLTISCTAIGSMFELSQQDELQKELQHLQDFYPQENIESLKAQLSALFSNNIYPNEPINNFINKLNSSENTTSLKMAKTVQDYIDIFNILKTKMNISDEIQLYVITNNALIAGTNIPENAFYDAHERKVYISSRFFADTPSTGIFKLIHELTHAQQHQKLGLSRFKDRMYDRSFDLENDADTRAINAIKCPVCIQIIEDEWPKSKTRSSLGYLSFNEVKQYKKQKHTINTCKAHAADNSEARQLCSLLPSKSNCIECLQNIFTKDKSLERLKLDFEISTSAHDRLSSVKFD